MNKKVIIFLTYILLIIALSFSDTSKVNYFFPIWKYDKIFHFFEYLILGILSASAIRSIDDKNFIIITTIFIILFPFLDETIQYFIPTRVYDIKDIFVDIVGAQVGLSLYVEKIKND